VKGEYFNMLDKLKNLEAEQNILSALISNNNKIYNLELDVEDFYDSKNKNIYSSICELIDKRKKADLITISQDLINKGLLEDTGGRSYLAKITVDIYGNLKECIEIVKDNSIRRKLLQAQELNQSLIMDSSNNIDKVLAETQNNIFEVTNFKKQNDSIKKTIDELYDIRAEYSEKYKDGQKYLGFETGLKKLDDAIDGLRAGHLWVVGGWTSTGKTQFSLNIVNSVLNQDVPTSIFSLEMSKVDLLARLIGIRTNLSSTRIIKGMNEPVVADLIEKQIDTLSRKPVEIHNTYYDIDKIKMMIRKDVYTRGVKFIVLDYLQNIQSEKYSKEYEIISKSITQLYALALELGITILVVSQISNESQKGMGAGGGFKGSGTIEAAADFAIKLTREKDEENPNDNAVSVKVRITKNRHGFTGVIDDYFMYVKSGLYHQNSNIEEGISIKNNLN